MGEVAKEAGVAYGLLYHYFSSKEEVLETIFRETWTGMLETARSIEAAGGLTPEQLWKVAEVILRSWRRDRSRPCAHPRGHPEPAAAGGQIEEIGHAVDALERIIRRGQEAGEFRPELEPRLASLVVYGAVEQILTSWVLGRPPEDDEAVDRAEETVVEMLVDGLVATGSAFGQLDHTEGRRTRRERVVALPLPPTVALAPTSRTRSSPASRSPRRRA